MFAFTAKQKARKLELKIAKAGAFYAYPGDNGAQTDHVKSVMAAYDKKLKEPEKVVAIRCWSDYCN
jgi:hypothetical protein